MTRRPRVRGTAGTVAVAVLVVGVLAGCSGSPGDSDESEPVTPSTFAEPSSGASRSAEPPVPSVTSTSLPTVGLPTQARFRLLDAGRRARAPEIRAYVRFWEEATESIRAYQASDTLSRLVSPQVRKEFSDKAGRDRRVRRTVSLRPVGRLESLRTSGARAQVTACVWSPSVSYYYEVDGSPAENIEQKWVEVVTDLRRTGKAWIVTKHARTGQSCRGGKP